MIASNPRMHVFMYVCIGSRSVLILCPQTVALDLPVRVASSVALCGPKFTKFKTMYD